MHTKKGARGVIDVAMVNGRTKEPKTLASSVFVPPKAAAIAFEADLLEQQRKHQDQVCAEKVTNARLV
jgi:hypothetical protein